MGVFIDSQNRYNHEIVQTFPQEYAAKLEPLVIFEQNGTKTTNICTLKQFVLLEQLLKQALTQEVDNLPTFVWSSRSRRTKNDQCHEVCSY